MEIRMKKTSFNVSRNIFIKLDDVSKRFNISKRKLVVKIFFYCHNCMNFDKVAGGLSVYQKKVPGDKWKCLRVDFEDIDCDLYLLYRYRFRISLSKLLAVGFVLFFDQIINELSEKSDLEFQDIDQLLNSYTEIRQILYAYVEDSFKYFILKQEKEP